MIDLAKGLSATVVHVPSAGVPSAATLSFLSPTGESLATPTVTVDSTGPLTVSSVSGVRIVTLDSATGLVVGRPYWWTSTRGGGGLVYVSEIDTLVVTLESAPPGALRVGDTLRGVRCTATVPDTATATLGVHYLLRWRTTIDGETHDGAESAAVVAQKFAAPMTPSEAARYIAGAYPSAISQSQDAGRWRSLADRVNARVRESAIQQERYPHLSGDYRLWYRAGVAALRWELAHEGLVPQGEDASTYRREQERELADAVRQAMTGSPRMGAGSDDPEPVQTSGSRRVWRSS